jgi:methylase of polypeptide subunit release factors
VRRAETGRFPEDPLLAIDGGDDGLDLARLCLGVADAHLMAGGTVLLQLGTEDQVDEIATWASEHVGLRVTESRRHGTRGVLVRLDRPVAS